MIENAEVNNLTAHLFRKNAGKMVAYLCSRYSLQHIDDILDIVHDTFETALVQWKFSALPRNPEGWLMQVAKNKAINYFKREQRKIVIDPFELSYSMSRLEEAHPDPNQKISEIGDSQLRLLSACCELETSSKNKIILTLHIMCGFGIVEIANALLIKEQTAKKALYRARSLLKQKAEIFKESIGHREERVVRLAHTILYLMFNEGYKTSNSPTVLNHELCFEAMRLTKLILQEEAVLNHETSALLALMFFNISRFPARLSTTDEMVSLSDQDRTKWDQSFITEGHYYLSRATQGVELSSYHLEAIISSVHCAATKFEETEWDKIEFLYSQLATTNPTPLVLLNGIVAKSYTQGCKIALQHLEVLKNSFKLPNELYWIVAADLYDRIGRVEPAREAYLKALEFAGNRHDKQFLLKKLKDLDALR